MKRLFSLLVLSCLCVTCVAFSELAPSLELGLDDLRVEMFLYRFIDRATYYGVTIVNEPSPNLDVNDNVFSFSSPDVIVSYGPDGLLWSIEARNPLYSTLSSFALTLSALDGLRDDYFGFSKEASYKEKARTQSLLNYVIASGSFSTNYCTITIDKSDNQYSLSIIFEYE